MKKTFKNIGKETIFVGPNNTEVKPNELYTMECDPIIKEIKHSYSVVDATGREISAPIQVNDYELVKSVFPSESNDTDTSSSEDHLFYEKIRELHTGFNDYVDYYPGSKEITLDGDFNLEQLELMVEFIKEKQKHEN